MVNFLVSQSTMTLIYHKIIKSFLPSQFIAPRGIFWFMSNKHYQTIVGSGALRQLFGLLWLLNWNFVTNKERFLTDDKDFFDVEYSSNFEQSDRVVIVLHGLEGHSKGALTSSIGQCLVKHGFGCALLSHRGCSGETNHSTHGYHLGFTRDLDQLVRTINKRFPTKRIYLTGLSMGGNMLLKYLGELGDDAKSINIYGASAACVPFDPKACQVQLDETELFNLWMYSRVSRIYS